MPDTVISADRLGHLASVRHQFPAQTAASPDPNNDPNAPGGVAGVNPLLGQDWSAYTEVVWDVVPTAAVPTYSWETYRYVDGADLWLLQASGGPFVNVPTSIEQSSNGDRVYLRISALGGAGAAVQVYGRGVNRNRR